MTDFNSPTGLIRQATAGAVPVSTLAGVMLAVLIGTVLIIGTGLAGSEVLHNAAHDARHGLAFPCH